ncbi:MAG: hypothetical protein OXN88_11940 [Chloroflexota bacterium]|nr:hypothetical protein [Chloroflexota bacterium]
MDKLTMTDSQDCVLFYDSDGFNSDPDRQRKLFFIAASSEDYQRLRYDLENNDVLVNLWIRVVDDERESEEDDRSLCFEALGRRFLKTEAVTVSGMTAYVGREYFHNLYETNNNPDLLAFVGVRAA